MRVLLKAPPPSLLTKRCDFKGASAPFFLMKQRKFHVITDTEIIGSTFLVVCRTHETKRVRHFWWADLDAFKTFAANPNITFVGFNSHNFDSLLIQAWMDGVGGDKLKHIASTIIEEQLTHWQTKQRFDISDITLDWIDLKEPAPGVMLSLKTYEGRMHFQRLQDMPIDHTADISDDPKAKALVLQYCENDCEATDALFTTIRPEIDLRVAMSQTYGVDLRSKSGAQAAEAILRKVCNIPRNDAQPPNTVTYKAPSFIQTDNPLILDLIQRIEAHEFVINPNNGSPAFPDFLKAPIKLGYGTYQFGIGGLHSQHDTKRHLQASPTLALADWDVASYYPSLLIAAGLIPKLPDGKGEVFLQTYKDIFAKRIEAKRSGDKLTANSLKLVLNSTFGKLGNQFCSFYSPDLMLAVTITGQLNLLCLIDAIERVPTVQCESANTDGIMLSYHPDHAAEVAAVIQANSQLTGFEYEETPYREIAIRDVNSYIAVTTDGKAKRKGAFSKAGVMEGTNPTFQICAEAAARYMADRTPIETTVNECDDIREFVAIRNVTGGGIQHIYSVNVDDWQLVKDLGTKDNEWYSARLDKTVTRKSRPKPVPMGAGGKPFGRVARWYRSTKRYQPLTYVTSGNRVPDTEQAKLCLDLPTTFPNDIQFSWYIDRAYEMLESSGVKGRRGADKTEDHQ